jgi:4'-phosphopantetheinyl transferase
MPLVVNEKNEFGSLLIWKTEESPSYFFDRLSLTKSLLLEVEEKHPKNMLEWLTSRYLLCLFLKTKKPMYYKDIYGKPQFLNPIHGFFSWSHSSHFTALIVHPDIQVGIDIQVESEKVLKVAKRIHHFQDEALTNNAVFCHYLWCSKEAIYKAWGRRSLDFRYHIKVPETYSNGFLLNAAIDKDETEVSFNLVFNKMFGTLYVAIAKQLID